MSFWEFRRTFASFRVLKFDHLKVWLGFLGVGWGGAVNRPNWQRGEFGRGNLELCLVYPLTLVFIEFSLARLLNFRFNLFDSLNLQRHHSVTLWEPYFDDLMFIIKFGVRVSSPVNESKFFLLCLEIREYLLVEFCLCLFLNSLNFQVESYLFVFRWCFSGFIFLFWVVQNQWVFDATALRGFYLWRRPVEFGILFTDYFWQKLSLSIGLYFQDLFVMAL